VESETHGNFKESIMTSLMGRLHRKVLRNLRLPGFSSTLHVVIAGRKFRVPVVDGSHCDVSEPWMLDLQARLLASRTGTFIDVGMNLGQTLLVVKAIEPARSYLGFEPNPQCFSYCEKLVRVNDLTDVAMVPVGLSSSNGIVRLQLYSESETDSAASVVDDFRPGQPVKAIKFVPVFSFADISKTLKVDDVGIVKIDVEGAEADVLEAMEPTLTAARPWIVSEILPCYDSNSTRRIARQGAIETMLCRLDYQIMRIGKDSNGWLRQLEPIETIGIHDSLALSDYVFCPREDIGRVLAAVHGAGQ
jgi:FkbM family methyltransferase